LSEEDKAVEQYEAMKAELSDLLGRAEALASDGEEQRALLMEGCEKLVERFLT
jgi:CHASE3 domain sensor protein